MSELTDNDEKTIKLIVDETSDAVVRKLTSYECGKHANQWIPVTERFPEDGKTVMVTADDAWENARKIMLGTEEGGYSADELAEIFGRDFGTTYTILYKCDALEVAAKIKAYEEEKNKIRIGDEVFSYVFNDKGIVTKIGSNNIITIVCDKISSISTSIDKVHKTGKSYPQIVEYYKFLEQYSKDKKESEKSNNE